MWRLHTRVGRQTNFFSYHQKFCAFVCAESENNIHSLICERFEVPPWQFLEALFHFFKENTKNNTEDNIECLWNVIFWNLRMRFGLKPNFRDSSLLSYFKFYRYVRFRISAIYGVKLQVRSKVRLNAAARWRSDVSFTWHAYWRSTRLLALSLNNLVRWIYQWPAVFPV